MEKNGNEKGEPCQPRVEGGARPVAKRSFKVGLRSILGLMLSPCQWGLFSNTDGSELSRGDPVPVSEEI